MIYKFFVFSKEEVFAIAILLVLLCSFFIAHLLSAPRYPELEEFENKNLSFEEYATFFEQLAMNKGGEYAYQVLLQANIAPGTDLHLLGHVIGDVLYKQEGIDGIYVCTPDFRNACSHSIVVGLFTDEGIGALDKIANACSDAPGGSGAYTMCFHGLGHGVLAYANYDFENALSICSKTGTTERNNREYIECVGGSMMEMISGVHDRTQWDIQKDFYFKTNDPLAPCDAAFVPDFVRPICYTYLTPHLLESAGADLQSPTPDDYERAFAYCDSLEENDVDGRAACYGGFGKEFIVLARDRDIRDVTTISDDELQKVRAWCALAHNPFGEAACNGNALASLFWGGENNPDASLRFCETATDVHQKDECYGQLTQSMVFYLKQGFTRDSYCQKLPEPHKTFCSNAP